MAGIIAGAMAGGGEALQKAGVMLGQHTSRSILQQEMAEIQRMRDERLAEIRRGELTFAEELRRAPGKAAAEEIEKARTGFVDDPSGTARQRTPDEMAAAEESAYRKQGLVSEAMQVRSLEQQRQRDNQTALDRNRDNERADRQLAIAEKTFDVNAKGADMDRQIKEFTLENAKRVDALRKEFKTATPERRQQIEQELQILGAVKDNDQYLPVPLKDDMGNITGYQIFDKRRGVFVNQGSPTPGKPGAQGDRPPLESFDPRKKPKEEKKGDAAAPKKSDAPARPAPENDVLPHERGRRAEQVPAMRKFDNVTAAEIRSLLGKDNLNASELLMLESYKDHGDLNAQERAKIAAILKKSL